MVSGASQFLIPISRTKVNILRTRKYFGVPGLLEGVWWTLLGSSLLSSFGAGVPGWFKKNKAKSRECETDGLHRGHSISHSRLSRQQVSWDPGAAGGGVDFAFFFWGWCFGLVKKKTSRECETPSLTRDGLHGGPFHFSFPAKVSR